MLQLRRLPGIFRGRRGGRTRGDAAAQRALRAFLGQSLRHQPNDVGAAERAPRLAVGARDEVGPAVPHVLGALRVRRELDDLVAGRHGGRLRVRAVQQAAGLADVELRSWWERCLVWSHRCAARPVRRQAGTSQLRPASVRPAAASVHAGVAAADDASVAGAIQMSKIFG